jgi:hypothetical protein
MHTRAHAHTNQARTFAVVAPETGDLIQRVQHFLASADPHTLLSESKRLIQDISRQSDIITALPTPADEEPFENIFLANVATACDALRDVQVAEDPCIFFVAPCWYTALICVSVPSCRPQSRCYILSFPTQTHTKTQLLIHSIHGICYSGHVNGGTTVRIEGTHLAGDHAKVFILSVTVLASCAKII